MAAPRSLLNAANSFLNPNHVPTLTLTLSTRTRVTIFSSPTTNCDAARSRLTSSATRLLFPPPIPLPLPQVVVDDDEVEELTFLDDQDDNRRPSSKWLTPQYLSLRLRCSSLMKQEASDALNRHFRNRKPVDKLPEITKKPAEPHHRQLELIREAYAQPIDFIKDVVISDEGYFDTKKEVQE